MGCPLGTVVCYASAAGWPRRQVVAASISGAIRLLVGALSQLTVSRCLPTIHAARRLFSSSGLAWRCVTTETCRSGKCVSNVPWLAWHTLLCSISPSEQIPKLTVAVRDTSKATSNLSTAFHRTHARIRCKIKSLGLGRP